MTHYQLSPLENDILLSAHTSVQEKKDAFANESNNNNNNQCACLYQLSLSLAHEITKGQYVAGISLRNHSSLLNEQEEEQASSASFFEDTFFKGISTEASSFSDAISYLDKSIAQFLLSPSDSSETSDEARRMREFIVMAYGVLCLSIFAQNNFTGPSLFGENKHSSTSETSSQQKKRPDILGKIFSKFGADSNKLAIDMLSVEGETAYSKLYSPLYLLVARQFLVHSGIKSLKSYSWWKARCLIIHQRTLSHSVQTIFEEAEQAFTDAIEKIADNEEELKVRALLEKGLMYHYYKNTTKAQEYFLSSQKESGLESELTGALGVRTRYQSDQIAQLVLHAKSKSENSSNTNTGAKPQEVALNHDTLLEKPQLVDDFDKKETNLRVIDQALLLALCLDVKNNNPSHGLTSEEMLPYVARVALHPNNWMVHSHCLLIRSRLEAERSKTVTRAVLQIQALVDQFEDLTDGRNMDDSTYLLARHKGEDDQNAISVVRERMEYFYCLSFPPLFKLKRELGQKFMSIGAARSALEIFKELEMWDDIIKCHIIMNEPETAEKILRERLEVDPKNHNLWCILGDLAKKDEYYLKAWEVSGYKSSRAQRSLANSALRRGEYEKAIIHFEIALAISPMYPECWFSLGCCYMRREEWQKSLSAFTRVIQLKPDDGESWANMGSVYIKLDQFAKAQRVIEEALKTDQRNSWRVWENYLFVTMSVGEYQLAINALNTLMDLRDKYVDIDVFVALVRLLRILRSRTDKHDQDQAMFLQKRMVSLVERITSSISSDPRVWDACAQYYEVLGNAEQVLECRKKQVRSLHTSGWETDYSAFSKLADATLLLTQEYLKEGSKRSLGAAKMQLSSFVKRTQELFGSKPEHEKLREALEEVSRKFAEATQ